MKSLFSRFKTTANSNGNGSGNPSQPRQSLDTGTREKDDPNATIRGVTRSRSILRNHDRSGTPSSMSERASTSTAKDLPPRPITPGLSNGPSSGPGPGHGPGPGQGPAHGHAGRSVSDRIRAFEKHDHNAPPLPPKDAPRTSGTFRRGSYKPQSAPPLDTTDERPTTLEMPDFGADLVDESGFVPQWLRSAQPRSSSENVKKVMFQSPARPTTATVTAGSRDPPSRSASGPAERAMSPVPQQRAERRASSPIRLRSTTPTLPHGHQRSGSRSSSRASGRISATFSRAMGSTSSAALGHSPTKSTMSAVAPSEASTASAASYFALPESWSAAMDEELIANLGPRERARQEVLWEIVNSEEKYVDELVKLTEAYCKPLLPQPDTNPELPDPLDLQRTMSSANSVYSSAHGHGEHSLPIASQYSSAAPRISSESYRPPVGAHTMDADGADARRNAFDMLTRSSGQVHSSQSHRGQQRGLYSGRERGHRRLSSRGSISSIMPGPVTLPDDLEQVLTVIAAGILEGHLKLVTALRKRYDDQFPLVRNLADVFTTHSDILRGYATYILHLERALAQIDEASAMADTIANGGRRSSRRLEETQLGRLSKLIQSLEEAALPDGVPGLSISLSKPFQRLLKYPLLFQNLLYNTSPSTREYEATLAMVDEVQQIVRSIEDEKTSSEDRERARDAWARIEGIERNKALMAPKPTRVLVSETQVMREERKSHRRLSDMLKGKQEKWIVRFSDVSLLCETHGTTTLPISTVKEAKEAGIRSESLTDLSSKRMSLNRRQQSLKPRNLYRFIKVYEWHERLAKPMPPPPRVSLDHFRRASLDYRRTLGDVSEAAGSATVRQVRPTGTAVGQHTIPTKTEDGSSSPQKATGRSSPGNSAADDSESMSVMSFAFAGEARPKRGAAKRHSHTGAPRSPPRLAKPTVSSERRAASAAKFAHRLRDDVPTTIRPSSRVRRSLPPAMVPHSGGGALTPSDRNVVTPEIRPPWNGSTKPVERKVRPVSLTPRARDGEGVEGARVRREEGEGGELSQKMEKSGQESVRIRGVIGDGGRRNLGNRF